MPAIADLGAANICQWTVSTGLELLAAYAAGKKAEWSGVLVWGWWTVKIKVEMHAVG